MRKNNPLIFDLSGSHDDDDENGTIDFYDDETEEEEGELLAVGLTFEESQDCPGQIKLSTTVRLKVWEDPDKSELLGIPGTPYNGTKLRESQPQKRFVD